MPLLPSPPPRPPGLVVLWGNLTPSPTIEALIAARLERLAAMYPGLGGARISFAIAPVRRWAGPEVDVHLEIDLRPSEPAERDQPPGSLLSRGSGPRLLEQAGKAETALLAVDAAFHALFHRLRTRQMADKTSSV